MSTVGEEKRIRGATITSLNSKDAEEWIAWLSGDSNSAPSETYGVQYALAHSDAGVTWGYLDNQASWKLGSDVDPVLCPRLEAKSLHELRVFGTEAEVLIWRGNEGLQGRMLADNDVIFNSSDPLRPLNEGRWLRGDPPEEHDHDSGFVRYVDGGGAQHLVPQSFPKKFSVRHYLEQDASTGAVRIAATRLVDTPVKLQRGV